MRLRTEGLSRFAAWLPPGILVLAGLAAYWGAGSAPFIFDDLSSIRANASIRHLGDIARVLRPPAGGETVTGRPVLNLSLALNHAAGGLSVRGYHALNVAIHLLGGLTLFGIARRTLARGPVGGPAGRAPALAAFAIALIWELHPLQTEAVTYVSQRAESLMGLFYLLTLYCFIRYARADETDALSTTDDRSRSGTPKHFAAFWAAGSIVCCLLGMGTKEVMASAPLVVFLYDRTFVSGGFRAAWRRHGRIHLALAGTWLVLGVCIALAGRRGRTAGFGVGMDWKHYGVIQLTAIAHYLRLCFWPHPLIFDYGSRVAVSVASVARGAAVVALLAAGTAIALVRRPALGFLGFCFFALLAPSSSVVPVATQVMAEHRMYLPLAAVAALAVCAGLAGLENLGGGTAVRAGLAAFLLLGAALGWATVRRNADYRSILSIWGETVSAFPSNPRAHEQLAVELARLPARFPEAIAQDEEALRLDPDDAGAHNNLANVLARIPGRLPEAVAQYREALRLDPENPSTLNNLANALVRLPGRLPDAIDAYRQALRLNPNYAEAHNNLGNALARIPSRLPDALAEFQQALRLDPNYADAHNGLAIVYAESGRLDEAVSQLEIALKLDPALPNARENLEKLRAAQR